MGLSVPEQGAPGCQIAPGHLATSRHQGHEPRQSCEGDNANLNQ